MNQIANLGATLKEYLKADPDANCSIPSRIIEQTVEELERQEKEFLKLVEDYDTLLTQIAVAADFQLRGNDDQA